MPWDPHPFQCGLHMMLWEPTWDPHPVPWDPHQPSAMGTPPFSARPSQGAQHPSGCFQLPLCMQQGPGDRQSQGGRGQGTPDSAPMGALPSLIPQPCPWSHQASAPPHPPTTAVPVGGTLHPLGTRGAAGGDTLGCAHHPAPRTQRPRSGSAREVGAGGPGGVRGTAGGGSWLCVFPCPHEELQQVHSTPLPTGGPGHGPIHGSRGEWRPDLGLEWPQRRGHDGDTGAAVAGGNWQQLPVFSTPKPRRGSGSLASGGTRAPVPPPHGWQPPVTR